MDQASKILIVYLAQKCPIKCAARASYLFDKMSYVVVKLDDFLHLTKKLKETDDVIIATKKTKIKKSKDLYKKSAAVSKSSDESSADYE